MEAKKILCIVYPFYSFNRQKFVPPSARVMRIWKQKIETAAKNPNAVMVLVNDFPHPVVGKEGDLTKPEAVELQKFFDFAREKFGEQRILGFHLSPGSYNGMHYTFARAGLPDMFRERGIVFGENVAIERVGQHSGGTNCVNFISSVLAESLSKTFGIRAVSEPMNPSDCVEFPVSRIERLSERFQAGSIPGRRKRLAKLLQPKPK